MTKKYGFLGLALRLRFIQQWPAIRCIEPQSVLEHIAVVNLLVLLAGKIALSNGKQVDLGKMMAYATLINVHKALCPDIPLSTQQMSPEIKKAAKKLEQIAQKRVLDTLPSQIKDSIADALSPGGYEQMLVEACDAYAGYIKHELEDKAGNKDDFWEVNSDAWKFIDKNEKKIPELTELHDWFSSRLTSCFDMLVNFNKYS